MPGKIEPDRGQRLLSRQAKPKKRPRLAGRSLAGPVKSAAALSTRRLRRACPRGDTARPGVLMRRTRGLAAPYIPRTHGSRAPRHGRSAAARRRSIAAAARRGGEPAGQGEERETARIVAQSGRGPGRRPPHSPRFFQSPTVSRCRPLQRAWRQARPGGGSARRVALPPSHTPTALAFPLPRGQGRPRPGHISSTLLAPRSTPIPYRPPSPPARPSLPACLPAFPSPLPARSTCSSGSSNRIVVVGVWLASLVATSCCFDRLAFKSGTTTDPRLSRIGQVHQIAS
jgi:hypothetical protein